MKTLAKRDIQLEALIWKTKIYETKEKLRGVQKKLKKTKQKFNDKGSIENFGILKNTLNQYTEEINQLQQRISQFEEKLYQIELNTSKGESIFFQQADDISKIVKDISKNILAFSLRTSSYADSLNPI